MMLRQKGRPGCREVDEPLDAINVQEHSDRDCSTMHEVGTLKLRGQCDRGMVQFVSSGSAHSGTAQRKVEMRYLHATATLDCTWLGDALELSSLVEVSWSHVIYWCSNPERRCLALRLSLARAHSVCDAAPTTCGKIAPLRLNVSLSSASTCPRA